MNQRASEEVFNSLRKEIPIIKKPAHLFALQINGLVSILQRSVIKEFRCIAHVDLYVSLRKILT